MLSKIQSLIGITKSELISTLFILTFGLGGFFISLFAVSENSDKQSLYADIYHRLDSLAEANKSTFTGTDNYGNQYEKLEKGDTLVKKELNFGPNKSEKEKDTKIINGKINLNTASKVELMKIPGIGEKTALKIIEYRNNTKFNTIEDIMNIKGIGIKKFEKMKDYIGI